MSLYRYVGGRPVMATDPYGLFPVGELTVTVDVDTAHSSNPLDQIWDSIVKTTWRAPNRGNAPAAGQISPPPCFCNHVRLLQTVKTRQVFAASFFDSFKDWRHETDRLITAGSVKDFVRGSKNTPPEPGTPGTHPSQAQNIDQPGGRPSVGGIRVQTQNFEICAVCLDQTSPQANEVFGCAHIEIVTQAAAPDTKDIVVRIGRVAGSKSITAKTSYGRNDVLMVGPSWGGAPSQDWLKKTGSIYKWVPFTGR